MPSQMYITGTFRGVTWVQTWPITTLSAKVNDVGLRSRSVLPGTRAAPCARAPAGDIIFSLSLHHGIHPHMLVSCGQNWFNPTCYSKNYIWREKAGFTKCPAGTDAHDCGFASRASGSHISQHYGVKRGGGDLEACDWQVMLTRTLQGVWVKMGKLNFLGNASPLHHRYFWSYRLRPYSCDI